MALTTDGMVSSKKEESFHPKPTDTIFTSVITHSLKDFPHHPPPSYPSYPVPSHQPTQPGLFCPFAHRANLVRHIKHLETILPVSIVRPYPKGEPGWRFDETYPNATRDHLFSSRFMHQLYFRDDPAYKGVYSVPLLWDKKTQRIVNNESAEMLAWLPSAFNPLIADQKIAAISFHPPSLRAQIDEITPWLTSLICSGVYKAGFNSTQDGYDAAVVPLFAALNKLEALVHANGGPYILGDTLTALDLLAYPTIVRFDAVYVQHFKTNLGIIRHDYPVLNNWLKGLYWHVEGFRESTDFLHIKENVSLRFVVPGWRAPGMRADKETQYTKSHKDINPLAITPMGPYPEVEEGFERDWSKLQPGKVAHPLVLEAQGKM
jgi:putative glutathione S-transferase